MSFCVCNTVPLRKKHESGLRRSHLIPSSFYRATTQSHIAADSPLNNILINVSRLSQSSTTVLVVLLIYLMYPVISPSRRNSVVRTSRPFSLKKTWIIIIKITINSNKPTKDTPKWVKQLQPSITTKPTNVESALDHVQNILLLNGTLPSS